MASVRLYCEGLASILGKCSDLDVLLAASPADTAAADLAALAPDVVVLDLTTVWLPGWVGELRGACPRAKLVAFAVEETPRHILACAEAGLSAFLPAQGSVEDLARVIRTCAEGEFVCTGRSASIMYRQLQRLVRNATDGSSLSALTLRERQILEHVDRGLSNKEIAEALHIQVATVKNHVHRVLEKLQARSRTEAAMFLRCAREPRAQLDLEGI